MTVLFFPQQPRTPVKVKSDFQNKYIYTHYSEFWIQVWETGPEKTLDEEQIEETL